MASCACPRNLLQRLRMSYCAMQNVEWNVVLPRNSMTVPTAIATLVMLCLFSLCVPSFALSSCVSSVYCVTYYICPHVRYCVVLDRFLCSSMLLLCMFDQIRWRCDESGNGQYSNASRQDHSQKDSFDQRIKHDYSWKGLMPNFDFLSSWTLRPTQSITGWIRLMIACRSNIRYLFTISDQIYVI